MNHAVSVLITIASFLSAHQSQDPQAQTMSKSKIVSFSILVQQGGTNKPISSALVTIDSTYKRYTNSAGIAQFENVELEGDSSATVEKSGYQFGALTVFLDSPPNTQYHIDIGYAEKMPKRKKKHR